MRVCVATSFYATLDLSSGTTNAAAATAAATAFTHCLGMRMFVCVCEYVCVYVCVVIDQQQRQFFELTIIVYVNFLHSALFSHSSNNTNTIADTTTTTITRDKYNDNDDWFLVSFSFAFYINWIYVHTLLLRSLYYLFLLLLRTHTRCACLCCLLLLTELGTQQNSPLITTERDARPTHRLEALVANLKNELTNKCGRRVVNVEWRE